MNQLGSFSRILLILWKNYLLRRRRYIITTLEVFCPTFLILVIVILKLVIESESSGFEGSSRKRLDNIEIDRRNKTVNPVTLEKNIFSAETYREYRSSFPGSIIAYSPNDTKTTWLMEKLHADIGNILGTDFTLRGYKSEEEIEMSIINQKREAESTTTTEGSFSGSGPSEPKNPGIAFVIKLTKSGSSDAVKFSYKIRLPSGQSRYQSYDFEKTDKFFKPRRMGYREFEDDRNRDFTGYLASGFTLIQIKLDKILIENLTSNASREIQKINIQKFPTPGFEEAQSSGSARELEGFVSNLLILGFMFIVPTIMLNVVSEKQSGIKELMKMMGLPNWMHWLGWMLNSMVTHALTITILVILLCGIARQPILEWSDPSVIWVSLFLYLVSATAFLFFISVLFQIPMIANIVAIVVWIATYFGTTVPIDNDAMEREFTIGDRMAVALLPNYAFALLMKAIFGLENKGVGARWKFIAEPLNRFDPLTFGHSWLMFIVDTILYMALTIYLENVIPSEYGVRKTWYYIFLPSTWGCRVRRAVQIAPAVTGGQDETMGFEAEPAELTAGIVIKNLGKRFGRVKVAVDNVSFKMFDGQITVLLGHNGAGKTTTMSILTGLIAPSSGTAVINGYDINTQMDYVRSSLGLCPQHNLLFDKLNVREHLIFFGMLKGLSRGQAKTETISLMQQIKLAEKQSVLSKALSGGQKRKLSLGIALIGGTKVLILDEPTSGMDPEARRAIWDILLAMRGSRTILLTTHFMEEADILGDRIAIMAGGKLQCCGTPAYLKKFYGAGYTLKMTIEENTDKEAILTSVQNHIPSAFWKFQKFPNATEIAITLPTEGESTTLYPAMFTDLTENKEKLGIRTMSLSLTTMDEVFVKVGELLTGEDHTQVDLTAGRVAASPTLVKTKGFRLTLQQSWGLLLKRILYTLRQRKMLLLQIVVPLVILIGSISLLNVDLTMSGAPPPLTMTLSDYSDTKTLYFTLFTDLNTSYPEVVGSSASYKNPYIVDRLLEVGSRDEGDYRAHYIVAAQMERGNVTALFSTVAYHSSPLSVNLMSNAILRSRSPTKQHSIEVTNHPLFDDSTGDDYDSDRRNTGTPTVFGIILTIGLALFAASFVIFPTEEKICQAKQIQLMTGVSPLVFWGSSFLWDFFLVGFVALLMVACLFIFEVDGVLTVSGGGGVAFLIMMIFGFTAIPFAYLLSLFAKSVPGGFALVSTIHLLSGLFFGIIVYTTESIVTDTPTFGIILRILGFMFPNFGATISMMKYSELAIANSRCNMIPEKYKPFICDRTPREPLFPKYYPCCETCMMADPTEGNRFGGPPITCFKKMPYLVFSRTVQKFRGTSSFPGIVQELLYLFLLGVIYHFIFLLLEYKVGRKAQHLAASTGRNAFASPGEEDVVEESNRVQYMIQSGRVIEDALVVGNLCKSFGNFSAVANLSFGVHYGECFGLLGVNGAGKTTTFRMLTGDEIRSSGNAFGFNCSLEKNGAKFFQNIGYCPQYDGIVGVMTGRETLELFGRLRGIPGRHVKSEANKWLSKMGLLEAGNVKCKNYSGGMKRRLSAGVALIGDPKIIFLDEPTSGVDPVSRRHFWKVLAELRDQGQSIILTSHSMEECEALCSRLGIMVNGQFQCFGPVQHLKNKYAQGFSLFLKLKPLIPVDHPGVLALQGEITVKFEPCALKDQHQNVLHYQLYNYAMPWNVFFQIMEDLRVQFQDIIEDYSVNETTLEEVFLAFARLQYPQRVAKIQFCTKLLTCQCGCFS